MQLYPVRASHRANLSPEPLEAMVKAEFGEAARDGDEVSTKFGAISQLRVGAKGKELSVELTMDPKVPEDVARETIARYYRFLEQVTGYSAKERAKRLRKAAPG